MKLSTLKPPYGTPHDGLLLGDLLDPPIVLLDALV
jgi:hypothetical protein